MAEQEATQRTRSVWSRPAHETAAAAEVRLRATEILKVCGAGSVLVIGCGDGALIRELLRRGVDAHGVEADAGAVQRARMAAGDRIRVADGARLPCDDRGFDTVVCLGVLDRIPAEHLGDAIGELRRVVRRNLFLRVHPGAEGADPGDPRAAGRLFWEEAMIAAGFRKHPREMLVADYASREHAAAPANLVFERLPRATAERYPLQALRAERDLHMDMTRETGRLADARIARYIEASCFVRPGDRVLDVACGLGYGSWTLLQASRAAEVHGMDESAYAIDYATSSFTEGDLPIRFSIGDAQDLGALADASIDFIVSVETLEHLHEPERFLAEAYRVLTPGGRVYLSVPNDWSDESGDDPNPHHHHVYDWARLRDQVGAHFVLERAWGQVAGGGMRLHDAPRQLREFSAVTGPDEDCEWLLVLAMKDPASGAALPYRERAHHAAEPVPNILAFARDYANPWLVRAMVSIGLRATSPSTLATFAAHALRSAPKDGADYGAALCVQAYRALDGLWQHGLPGELLGEIERYRGLPPGNPNVFRWQISLGYVEGALLLESGRLAEAEHVLQWVAQQDANGYSPLIATKTIAAACLLGHLRAGRGDSEGAVAAWRSGVAACAHLLQGDWREVVGDPQWPVTFGLPELAVALSEGARCANAIVAASSLRGRQGEAWQLAHASMLDTVADQEAELLGLKRWISELEKAKDGLAERAEDLERGKTWIEEQWTVARAELERHAAWIDELEHGKAWLESAWQQRGQEIERLGAHLEETRRSLDGTRSELADLYRRWPVRLLARLGLLPRRRSPPGG